MLETVNSTTDTLSMALAGIAGISLFVGGFMNIMIVSVNKRTREIGIRKAIGAKKFDILAQFMIESIAWDMVLIAFVFSLLIDVIFGMMPANKAARLRPIHALRNE